MVQIKEINASVMKENPGLQNIQEDCAGTAQYNS